MMKNNEFTNQATENTKNGQVFTCCFLSDSDKVCKICKHYEYGGFCDIDDKRTGANDYCPYFSL